MYVLDEDGRIRKAIDLDCADDAAAREEARQYVDGPPCGARAALEMGQPAQATLLTSCPPGIGQSVRHRCLVGINEPT